MKRDVTALASPPPAWTETPSRDLAGLVVRAAAQVAWTARNPSERFANRADGPPPDRVYYQAADGWEAPLLRYAPRHGASGEPLLLAHGLGTGATALDFREERSLARAAWRRGYDVYLLSHRGDRGSVPPPRARSFDFDDIVDLDLPAALDAVRRASGAERVLWLGHAMGGQLLYGHLARGGADDLAAGVALCAPVRFEAPRSAARVAAVVARLLPTGWRIPTRGLNRAMAPLGAPASLRALADDTDGPDLRGWMLDGVEDVDAGLARQVARWVSTGAMCDRSDRFDYVSALAGVRLPVMVVAAGGDRICPPAAALPAAEALDARDLCWEELDESWGHLDVLLGRRAADELFPLLLDWLEEHRRDCWKPAR